MSDIQSKNDSSNWLGYSPDKAIERLVFDVSGFLGFTQETAKALCEHEELRNLKLDQYTTANDLIQPLIKEAERLKATLDIMILYADNYRKDKNP